MLFLLSSVFISSLVNLFNGNFSLRSSAAFGPASSAVAAVVSILFFSLMPMRDPRLSKDGICEPFQPPTSVLRTPEDDLTLWQFLTVSWMSPLINRGFSKQLNADEVWALGYEFEHRTLHDLFHELKGSVTSRILQANGIDLAILTALALVELLSSKAQSSSTVHNTQHVYRSCRPRPLTAASFGNGN